MQNAMRIAIAQRNEMASFQCHTLDPTSILRPKTETVAVLAPGVTCYSREQMAMRACGIFSRRRVCCFS